MILETASTQVELECSWEVVERDISICERWEAKKGSPEIISNFSFPKSLVFLFMPSNPRISLEEEDFPLNIFLFLK